LKTRKFPIQRGTGVAMREDIVSLSAKVLNYLPISLLEEYDKEKKPYEGGRGALRVVESSWFATRLYREPMRSS